MGFDMVEEFNFLKDKALTVLNNLEPCVVKYTKDGITQTVKKLTEKIISQIKKEIGTPMKVIATGGLGRMISEEVQEINIYDKDLTFKGLLYIYHRMKHA